MLAGADRVPAEIAASPSWSDAGGACAASTISPRRIGDVVAAALHLRSRQCHQGTCDPASAALLPWLAATIAGFTDDGRETPLALAGFIALDATDADRIGNLSEIAALRAMAVARLPRASSASAFVYLLQAILGFDGDEIWGKELDHLNDGEVEVRCPACGEETLVDLLDDDSGLVAGLSGELAERLHAEAVRTGRESVATALTRLFGRIEAAQRALALAHRLTGVHLSEDTLTKPMYLALSVPPARSVDAETDPGTAPLYFHDVAPTVDQPEAMDLNGDGLIVAGLVRPRTRAGHRIRPVNKRCGSQMRLLPQATASRLGARDPRDLDAVSACRG